MGDRGRGPTAAARGVGLRPRARLAVLACLWSTVVAAGSSAQGDPDRHCIVASGGAAAECVQRYAAALAGCRKKADSVCEETLRSAGGPLESLLAATERPVRRHCTTEAADKLTFLLGVDDLVAKTSQACRLWGEDLADVSFAPGLTGHPADVLACQERVGTQLARLHRKVVRAFGRHCYADEAAGAPCDRKRRDDFVARARAAAAARIERACGAAFDALGLVSPSTGSTPEEHIDALTDVVASRARHLAQRVYPPLNLGPTGLFGPAPVGVRLLELVDPARPNVDGSGPRPVETEVYYPSTPDAVAGVPRDVPRILGTGLFPTPTHRDVARASGRLPLIVFSPGVASDPWMYVFLAAHLASHGFLVASVEHHGDHLFDTNDPDPDSNRPLDLSFVLDRLLVLDGEAGSFFEGAIDPDRVGAAGHSAGGTAAMALAMCPSSLGAFADARFRAILPLDPGAWKFLADQSPGIFSAIPVPTLLFGGSLSTQAGVPPIVFDALTPGPLVMAWANLIDGRHNTLDDLCELPDAVLAGFLTPRQLDCTPQSLPWRYSRHITHYLALNFFDATLNGNPEALARLDPAVVDAIEDVAFESKTSCPPSDSCSFSCADVVCGDGSIGPHEACDPAGEQGACAAGELCNANCSACADCADATVVDPAGGVIEGTTVGAPSALGSSCVPVDSTAPDQVFQWTPAVTHVATIQTCGGTTDFDTTLYVREGTCVGADLACNDDAGDAACGFGSMLTLPVVAGTTYFIVVDGFAQAGHFTLNVE